MIELATQSGQMESNIVVTRKTPPLTGIGDIAQHSMSLLISSVDL